MKKSAKPRKSKTRAKTSAPSPDQPKRNTLRLIRNAALGAIVLGGAGVFGTRSVMATMAEFDLTRLGQGTPTIVQIHDPNCATCTALQRETRKALGAFEDDDLLYLVANITTAEGAEFAAKHGVPHVTLLLFDGDGNLRETLQGMRQRDELTQLFRQHHKAFTPS